MAVISSVPGLEVTVVIGGVSAQEYAVPDGEERVPDNVTRQGYHVPPNSSQSLPYTAQYIEAKPGEQYAFKVKKGPGFQNRSNHIAYRITLDGNQLGLVHDMSKRKHDWETITDACCTGSPTEGYTSHRFQFAALDIMETDKISATELTTQKLMAERYGKLLVSFYRMRKSELRKENVAPPWHQPAINVAEKAIKGKTVDCFTTYVAQPNPTAPKWLLDDYQDDMKRPFAVFEFRYRTREGLMRHGVIPRPTIAEEVQDMSEQEIRQRLTQMLEATKQSSHDHGQRDSEETKPRIKREAEEMGDEFMARYKARRLENGRVEVDFTDD